MANFQIELRGVHVNNLKDIDLDIQHGQLVSICGVSGSGKSSLAFETLFAEGQRRYFESLSTYTRQFLQQLDKPDADRIDGIPPAIALRANRHTALRGIDRHRATVADASELAAHLGLLYAKIGQLVCPDCDLNVEKHDPDSIIQFLKTLETGTKFQIAFELTAPDSAQEWRTHIELLRSTGFRRVIVDGNTLTLDEIDRLKQLKSVLVVVDRLSMKDELLERASDSLSTAFRHGGEVIHLLWQDETTTDLASIQIDGKTWNQSKFFRNLVCSNCSRVFPDPEPGLFSNSNPMGACQTCGGIGSTLKLDINRIVPDDSVSIADGAIAPWNTPAYSHELKELMELAKDYNIDVHCPFRDLGEQQLRLIWQGVKERDFGGLDGFFGWLEKRKYKVQIGVFLNRWKSQETCKSCNGRRLNSDALSFRIGAKNIFDFGQLEISQAKEFLTDHELSEYQDKKVGKLIGRIESRLRFLQKVGLGYIQLNRLISTLSSGESQRVMLTKILGSTLTSMLYVLDEPSSGLHAEETPSLVECIRSISKRGNTVVVVDHNENLILGAERIVEIGPGAGTAGGEIIFDGSPDEIFESDTTVTGFYLKRHSGLRPPEKPRRSTSRAIRIDGADGNNLKNLQCKFPLGCLCVVSGRSGSGKSSLVHDTLYPALCRAKNIACENGLPFKQVSGFENINDVVRVDQSPIGRSSRSNPVTYIKAFDEIRKTFAETIDSKSKNFKAGHFSFNVDGGRCEKCKGEGELTIDMQFMSDVHVRCDQCHGTRFRESVLQVKYRAKNIDDVLNMTAKDAFVFFRGKTKVQTKLKALMDVGLDYIRLGQPATTLSSGEAQRLKLAHYLNAPKTQKAVFFLDEPTFGLHAKDVTKLIECFDTLIAAGHSIIATEHNLHLLKHADWIIDLGPGAANDGGRIVAQGTPETVCNSAESVTGKHLGSLLQQESESLKAVE